MLDLGYANGMKVSIDTGITGVEPEGEFFTALEKIVPGGYHLAAIKEIFLEAPEKKPWERREA